MALRGLKVLEFAGLAPAPFCGMVLADHGASVIRIDKTSPITSDTMARGKRSIGVNLKTNAGVNVVKSLCRSADVLIEPFRPGVMEKLGLGPDLLCTQNPRLVYARLSGFGQTGSMSNMAGHDINYIATSGVLSRLGAAKQAPYAPINLLADFGGGGLMCALGVVMALFERTTSGKGQIIDVSMTHGSAYLSSFLWSSLRLGKYGVPLWPSEERGVNLLDGGSAFYGTYETKDGKYMAVGALEPQFYSQLLKVLKLDEGRYPQHSTSPAKLRPVLIERFKCKTQQEWTTLFDNTDACVTPVISLHEAHKHPHNEQTFVEAEDGFIEPTPAPILSRTPGSVGHNSESTRALSRQPMVGEHTIEILKEHEYNQRDIESLLKEGVVVQCNSSKL